MKKTTKKNADKPRITLARLLDRIVFLESSDRIQANDIRVLGGKVDFDNNQLNELPRFRNQLHAIEEIVNRLQAMVARKYQLDVDAGVAEFIAKQKRDIANKGAIED
jgi:hypothetical protein